MRETFMHISDEKRRRVTEATLREFIAHGYKNASTNRLVRTLGISKGGLFKYFESKQALYMYLVEMATEQLLSHVKAVELSLNASDWRTGILAYAEQELRFLEAEPLLYQFFYRMRKEGSHPVVQSIMTDLTQKSVLVFADLLRQIGIGSNETLFTEHLYIVLDGYNRMWLDRWDFTAITDKQRTMYMEGLRAHLQLIRREAI